MELHTSEFANSISSIYIGLAVLLLSFLYYRNKTRGILPGPIGLPYLGLWPFLRHETCHLQLQKYMKKYGNIFSFTYTGRLYIHLGSVKAVREAHITKSDCFYERPSSFNLSNHFLHKGIFTLNGEHWKTMKKFFLQQFRERGMTSVKESFIAPIYDTVREINDDLKKANGQPVDIAVIFRAKCKKIINQTLFGGDGMSEQEMDEFTEAYFGHVISLTGLNFLLIGKFAKYFLFPFHLNIDEAKRVDPIMVDLLTRVINRRKKNFDENNVRDCVDNFFYEKRQRELKKDPKANYFEDIVLMNSLLEFVGDGVVSVTLFLTSFIQAAIENPEEQEKVYQELLEVVGTDKDPEVNDKGKLTYTNAFMLEAMRTTKMFSLFTSLECSKETTIGGYRIPKGAITVYNYWAAHMNPEDYDEPEKFKPSRFIVKEGQERPDFFVLFGMGKRSCMGEAFVMLQAFLFVTTILKNFRLTKPEAKIKEKCELYFYFEKLEICAHPRS